MSVVHLLDVNVLVALFDPDHVHHEIAHDWFADHREDGWATSPTTENGFVRVLTNPAYGGEITRAADALDRLRVFRASGHHHFWPDVVSLADQTLFRADHLRGHRQLTDVYLLGLATRMKGRLATFNGSVPLDAVFGAGPHAVAAIGSAAD